MKNGVLSERTMMEVLSCPLCHSPLSFQLGNINCKSCSFRGEVAEDIVVLRSKQDRSFFDDKFEVMKNGHSTGNGECQLCYNRQVQYFEPFLSANTRILDVGCGPAIPYRRDKGSFLIGLEASFDTIRANKDVDLGIFGTAAAMPLRNQSIDTIICLYSIHHMIGNTVEENNTLVRKAFAEFSRVLKPGGNLFICEVNPWPVIWFLQKTFWNKVHRLLGPSLDQFFWSKDRLSSLGKELLPRANLKVLPAATSPLTMIPPIFSAPWLKIPRMVYPLEANLFHWQISEGIKTSSGEKWPRCA